jgi:hypothetical protein
MVMKKHPEASTRKTKMTTSDLPFTELLLFLFWCLDAKGGEEYLVRLVPVVVWLYLTLAHAMSAFSLSLSHTSAPAAGYSIHPKTHQHQLSLSQSALPFQT